MSQISADRTREWFTPEERARLRAGFLSLIPVSDETAAEMYDRIFAAAPAARALFHGPIEAQHEKLMNMFASMLDMLDDPHGFYDACVALGARHVGYGTMPDHYPVVGQALIEAIRVTSPEPLSPEDESLWIRLYTVAADYMMDGDPSARPVPT